MGIIAIHEPFAVYSLASKCGLDDVAKIAAQRTLQLPSMYSGNQRVLAHVSTTVLLARLPVSVVRCGDDQGQREWTSEQSRRGTGSCWPRHVPCAVRIVLPDVARGNRVVSNPCLYSQLVACGKQLERLADPSCATSAGIMEPVFVSAIDHCATGIYGDM